MKDLLEPKSWSEAGAYDALRRGPILHVPMQSKGLTYASAHQLMTAQEHMYATVQQLLTIFSAMTISVYSEIRKHFRGFARLNLGDVRVTADNDAYEIEVKQLIRNFKMRGCLRHDPTYAISVMVDADTLATAADDQIDMTPSLDGSTIGHVNIRATCLHGKHRILAAQRALNEPDRWWTARLFESGR